MFKRVLFACFLIYVTSIPSAHAILDVADAKVLIEQTRTAMNTLEITVRQAEMIVNQIKMIENQAKNLAAMPYSLWSEVQGKMYRLVGLVNQVRSLSMQWELASRQFQSMFPGWDTYATQSSSDYAGRVYWWRKEVESSIQDAMEAQSLLGDTETDIYNLDQSILASESAQGALGAIQANSQIASLIVAQLMDMKQITGSYYRQQSLFLETKMSNREMDAARMRKQLSDWGKDGTREVMTEDEYLNFGR